MRPGWGVAELMDTADRRGCGGALEHRTRRETGRAREREGEGEGERERAS